MQVVGRTAELAELGRLLDAAGTGPVALCLYGVAGAGKSTLVDEACRLASSRGLGVLSCRPAQSESELSFTGIADLLAGVGDDTLARLPRPQRHALDVVLLRAEPDPGVDVAAPGAVATALLSAFGVLTERVPLLLAIDDLQWIDRDSARVLEFALRRLGALRVGVLTSIRSERSRSPGAALGLDRALPADRRRELEVGSLSLGALHRLVHAAFDPPLPRPALVQLAQLSGGNPFYALEIARALAAGAPVVPGEPLPVPETLRELVAARITALPAETRAVLLVAAVAAGPTMELLTTVSGHGRAALEPAFRQEVARLEDGRVRFTHPLLAAAVRSAANAEERTNVHRQLSVAAGDSEERARHLALCTTEPDEASAAILERAADAARRRGAPGLAAQLGQHSIRLTPPGATDRLAARSVAVAEHLLESGDNQAARALLTRGLAGMPAGPPRASALLVLGMICWFDGDPSHATSCYHAALAECGDRVQTAAAHAGLTLFCDDVLEAAEHAQTAVRLSDESDGPAKRSFALFRQFYCEVQAGRPPALDVLEKALTLETRAQSYQASLVPGIWAKSVDDFDTGRERFLCMLREAAEVGDESTPAGVLPHLAELELWAGEWRRARAYAAEAMLAAEQTGQAIARALRVQTLIAAHEGALDAARATALPQLSAPETSDGAMMVSMWLAVLGFVELSAERPGEADRWFRTLEERLAEVNMREPLRFRHAADHIEAVVALGDLGRAEALLLRLEERGRLIPRPSIAVTASRCRGLLSAARGDLDEAVAHLAAALDSCGFLPMPFEVARTHLVIGQVRRRRKEKRLAAAALREALQRFTDLGAACWAQRTGAELRRVGSRPAASLGLTETELRVAELVATGLTNRDVARILFVSPKTVEANLARAYQKLGIRSRAELGAVMRQRAQSLEKTS